MPVIGVLEIICHVVEGRWCEKGACPLLKKINMMFGYVDPYDEKERSFEFSGEVVEELVLKNLAYQEVKIDCKLLAKLEWVWQPLYDPPQKLPKRLRLVVSIAHFGSFEDRL